MKVKSESEVAQSCPTHSEEKTGRWRDGGGDSVLDMSGLRHVGGGVELAEALVGDSWD